MKSNPNLPQELESRQSHWVSFDVAKAVRVHQELGKPNIVFEIMYTPINPIDVSASSRGIRFTKSRGKQVRHNLCLIYLPIQVLSKDALARYQRLYFVYSPSYTSSPPAVHSDLHRRRLQRRRVGGREKRPDRSQHGGE